MNKHNKSVNTDLPQLERRLAEMSVEKNNVTGKKTQYPILLLQLHDYSHFHLLYHYSFPPSEIRSAFDHLHIPTTKSHHFLMPEVQQHFTVSSSYNSAYFHKIIINKHLPEKKKL